MVIQVIYSISVAKPLDKPMLIVHSTLTDKQRWSKYKHFHPRKCILFRPQYGHFYTLCILTFIRSDIAERQHTGWSRIVDLQHQEAPCDSACRTSHCRSSRTGQGRNGATNSQGRGFKGLQSRQLPLCYVRNINHNFLEVKPPWRKTMELCHYFYYPHYPPRHYFRLIFHYQYSLVSPISPLARILISKQYSLFQLKFWLTLTWKTYCCGIYPASSTRRHVIMQIASRTRFMQNAVLLNNFRIPYPWWTVHFVNKFNFLVSFSTCTLHWAVVSRN